MKKENLKGVEGWLYFIALILVVLDPVFIFFQLVLDSSTNFALFIFNAIVIGFSIFVGVSIFRKKEKAIIWAKEFLIAYLALALIDLIFYFVFLDQSYETDSFNPIRNVLFAVIWLLYLNKSERVRNTFKNTKLNWKRMTIILTLVVIGYLLFFLSYGFFNENSNYPDTPNNIINSQSSIITNGELEPNYVEFREFVDQLETREVTFEFSSNLPISVYFVPSKEDWNRFMASEQYNVYQGCSFEGRTFGIINCNVSTGGIILYNPNLQKTTYQVK